MPIKIRGIISIQRVTRVDEEKEGGVESIYTIIRAEGDTGLTRTISRFWLGWIYLNRDEGTDEWKYYY